MATTFKDQPSYTVFNKSIENTDDILFKFLNEVDPEILKEELQAQSQVFTSYANQFLTRSDPRKEHLMKCRVYDHTTDRLPYKFPNPKERYSMLSADQQSACLRLLLAWQQKRAENENDFVVWRATAGRRCKEQQLVQKHILENTNTQKESLHAYMKPLVLLYSIWFEKRMQYLLRAQPNASYSTSLGLPQLPQCNTLKKEAVSMTDVQLLCRRGQVRLWPVVQLLRHQLSTLGVRLERYAFAGVTDEPSSQLVRAALEQRLLEATEDVFVLPLEALLMLLTTSSYVDLPSEVVLNIREIPDSEHKSIEFEEPMPSRHCGCHTNSQIISQAYSAFAGEQWLQFTDDGNVVPMANSEAITASQNADHVPAEYKLIPIDDVAPDVVAKANRSLVSWRLSGDDAEDGLQIYSSLSISAVRDAAAEQLLGCHLIKVENKPDCGCEIMTKYELLSAWLQLKLNQTDVGHCSRISLRDLEPLLEVQLTLSDVEDQLGEYYNIKMPQLLCQLRELLKLLRSVTPGSYLLRYTEKYDDKFLICQPTTTLTSKSFKLHDLLLGTSLPNDINFLTHSNSYLPISARLCSRLHEQLQLLPCCFPVKVEGKRTASANKRAKLEEHPTLVQRTIKNKSNIKKTKRKSPKQLKKNAAEEQKKKDDELEKFMTL